MGNKGTFAMDVSIFTTGGYVGIHGSQRWVVDFLPELKL